MPISVQTTFYLDISDDDYIEFVIQGAL